MKNEIFLPRAFLAGARSNTPRIIFCSTRDPEEYSTVVNTAGANPHNRTMVFVRPLRPEVRPARSTRPRDELRALAAVEDSAGI